MLPKRSKRRAMSFEVSNPLQPATCIEARRQVHRCRPKKHFRAKDCPLQNKRRLKVIDVWRDRFFSHWNSRNVCPVVRSEAYAKKIPTKTVMWWIPTVARIERSKPNKQTVSWARSTGTGQILATKQIKGITLWGNNSVLEDKHLRSQRITNICWLVATVLSQTRETGWIPFSPSKPLTHTHNEGH